MTSVNLKTEFMGK